MGTHQWKIVCSVGSFEGEVLKERTQKREECGGSWWEGKKGEELEGKEKEKGEKGLNKGEESRGNGRGKHRRERKRNK